MQKYFCLLLFIICGLTQANIQKITHPSKTNSKSKTARYISLKQMLDKEEDAKTEATREFTEKNSDGTVSLITYTKDNNKSDIRVRSTEHTYKEKALLGVGAAGLVSSVGYLLCEIGGIYLSAQKIPNGKIRPWSEACILAALSLGTEAFGCFLAYRNTKATGHPFQRVKP